MRYLLPYAILFGAFSFTLSAQSDRVPAGTEIVVRTSEPVDAKYPSDNRVYLGTVDRDVQGRDNQILIPRGSEVELIMRNASSSDVLLDLESVKVNGKPYSVDSPAEPISGNGNRKEGFGTNQRTGKDGGGGAIIGGIIGAIAGGGK